MYGSSTLPGMNYGQQPQASGYGMQGVLRRPAVASGRRDWFELRKVTESDNVGIDPVLAMAFDPAEELVWSGLKSGRVVSYLSPLMERYTSFMAHTSHIQQLLPTRAGLLSLSSSSLRFHTRGGVSRARLTHTDMRHMTCATYTSSRHSEVLVAGENALMFLYDLDKGQLLRSVPVAADVTQAVGALARSRLLCCGGLDGKLTLRDPLQLKVQQTFLAHSAGISDVAMKGDLLVTCGWSQNRMGKLFVEPLIKVFDVRTMRQLNPIPFPHGPHLLKFHPKFSSTVLVTSQRGQFQLCDVQGDLNKMQFYQVDLGGELLTSFDVSSTGDAVCMGDMGGCVRQWADREDISVNDFSSPTELVPAAPPMPQVSMDEQTPLFVSQPLPAASLPLLSEWPLTQAVPVMRQARPVPRRFVAQAKQIDFVGLVQNHYGLKRNLALVTSSRDIERAIDAAEKSAGGQAGGQAAGSGSNAGSGSSSRPRKRRAPKKFRKYEIKRQAYNTEDINVSPYNKTMFGGLDNVLAASYANPAVQALYFLADVRAHAEGHLCKEEFCLTCELGFLFHMLDMSHGRICTNANLLRCLRHLPDADAHLRQRHAASTPGATLIERFFAFFLRRLAQEAVAHRTPALPTQPQPTPASASFFADKFGTTVLRRAQCRACGHTTESRQQELLHRMQYPDDEGQPQGAPPPTFSSLLRRLFDQRCVEEAKCGQCHVTGGHHVQRQFLGKLPEYLCLTANVSSAAHLRHWLGGKAAGLGGGDDATAAELGLGDFGMARGSKWLPFKVQISHAASGLVFTESSVPEVLRRSTESVEEETAEGAGGGAPAASEVVGYELVCVISEIRDTVPDHLRGHAKTPPPHYVAHIRADQQLLAAARRVSRAQEAPAASPRAHMPPGAMPAREGSPARTPGRLSPALGLSPSVPASPGGSMSAASHQWYLVNDFCITPAFVKDVCQFYEDWKHPAVVIFSRCSRPEPPASPAAASVADVAASVGRLSVADVESPIDDSCFMMENPLASHTLNMAKKRAAMVVTSPDQLPKAGELVAIDTEFVSLTPPETTKTAAGKTVVLKQGRYGLARVSAILGGEKLRPRTQEPHAVLIDDYIASREPISDYLTRFSGITAGDLDPVASPYEVTTLKAVYLKLRRLVDRGCVFVGHGLQKDFRIINLIVPKEQVVDTVSLFHLPHQRNLSLRFLAAFLLKLDIQADTHCSIEDARTALLLYAKYLELERTGALAATLQQIYHKGRQTNWTLPLLPDPPANV